MASHTQIGSLHSLIKKLAFMYIFIRLALPQGKKNTKILHPRNEEVGTCFNLLIIHAFFFLFFLMALLQGKRNTKTPHAPYCHDRSDASGLGPWSSPWRPRNDAVGTCVNLLLVLFFGVVLPQGTRNTKMPHAPCYDHSDDSGLGPWSSP